MRSISNSTRTPHQLSASLLNQLNHYALAATAAGVASIALAQPAEAKIVYTPAHIKIPRPPRFNGVSVPLDINHDGIDDFNINNFFGGSAPNSYAFMRVAGKPFGGNPALGKNCAAFALPAGMPVQFNNDCVSGDGMAGWRTVGGNSTTFAGQWANGGKGVKDRYLGLRFMIQGQVHFGWARLNVNFNNGAFAGLVTGYAYETIPNKAIITGKTKGTEDDGVEHLSPTSTAAPTREPATLGLLAVGSPGLSIWRREEVLGAAK
jgi:hypothetical protein